MLPLKNDPAIMGLLSVIIGAVFVTHASSHPFWKKLYSFFPSVLLLWFLPSIFHSAGLIDTSESRLYFFASRYLLPAGLILMIISVDLKKFIGLGPKACAMFLTGTLSIMIGGPLAILIIDQIAPSLVDGDVWRGLTTLAGSWIGGGANQAAMKEVFVVDDKLFSALVAVDVICAALWMAILLIASGQDEKINAWLKADTSAIEKLKFTVSQYEKENARPVTTTDMMKIIAIAFALTGLAHFFSDIIAPQIEMRAPGLARYSLTSRFFWLMVLATTFGLIASRYKAVRNLENAGASKIGQAFIYILVVTIGMNMDILAMKDSPGYFFIGILWLAIHAALMILMAKIIRAPLFFLAVGSEANVGGAASAPVVAAAFHPTLVPVAVILAVLGYVLGTYGAYITGLIMQAAAS